MIDSCYVGDVRDGLRAMIAAGIRAQTCVTSPPYWGLRDYCVLGQIGLEPTLEQYVATMVDVFRLVRDVLADDGTLWLNLGDSYSTQAGSVGECPGGGKQGELWRLRGAMTPPNRMPQAGLKPKDLCGVPWRVAFALQADGWYLRSDIIWHKPNPMPESVTDRPTKAHEYLFLLSKRERYFYDQGAVREECSPNTHERYALAAGGQFGMSGWARGDGPHDAVTHSQRRSQYKTPDGWDTSKGQGGHGSFHKDGREAGFTGYEPKPRHGSSAARKARANENTKSYPDARRNGQRKLAENGSGTKNNPSFDAAMAVMPERRNKRTVWTIPTEAFPEAHFATFPQALVEPCILAGSRTHDVVLDPFMGSGTVAQVALRLGRQWVGCELNPDYAAMQVKRTAQAGLPLVVA